MPATHASTVSVSSPSLLLVGAELWRAALEFIDMKRMDKQALPNGDGHAVVIFPGLATDHQAVAPLKNFCKDLGYNALDWGRGLNTGPQGYVDHWLDGLAEEVDDMTRSHAAPISLIGWSLGGIYAREVAKRLPTRARQVITLGTPFSGSPEHTRARLVYRLLNGKKPPSNKALAQRLAAAPQVPTTSIFSRTDGVVAWQACIQAGGERHCENIEVTGSHCGLAWNSEVYRVVADRLRQAPGQWQPMG
jgi:pimeloyl-ACP methyl ester carboxylesterase